MTGCRRRSCLIPVFPLHRDLKRSGGHADRISRLSVNVSKKVRTDATLAGDLAFVGMFDAVQVIENSRMTGLFVLKSDQDLASVSFNEGKIVDAEADGLNGQKAFRTIIDISSGTFEFALAENEFPVVIDVISNTNFILDTLTSLETEKAERKGMRSFSTTELRFGRQ